MALVADYGSDDDSITDSDEDVQYTSVSNAETKDESNINFFSLNEDEEDSNDSDKQVKGNSKPENERLPNPLLSRLSAPDTVEKEEKSAGLVFTNPFHQAEQEKASVLEKHVKMVEKKIVKGKAGQVCFKFKRGKCPFGKNCKYSHDLSSEMVSTQPSEEGTEGIYNTQGHSRIGFHHSLVCQPIEPELDDDDSYMSQAKKKKRSGINDLLQPPKKALHNLEKQRETERPWTVKKKR